MNWKLEFDLGVEAADAIGVVADLIKGKQVDMVQITMEGPGGGCPLVVMTSKNQFDLERIIREVYGAEQDTEFELHLYLTHL